MVLGFQDARFGFQVAGFGSRVSDFGVRGSFTTATACRVSGLEGPGVSALGLSVSGSGSDAPRVLADGAQVHFFGDKVHKGGNDHEIYEDARTVGHMVRNPEETLALLHQLFL